MDRSIPSSWFGGLVAATSLALTACGADPSATQADQEAEAALQLASRPDSSKCRYTCTAWTVCDPETSLQYCTASSKSPAGCRGGTDVVGSWRGCTPPVPWCSNYCTSWTPCDPATSTWTCLAQAPLYTPCVGGNNAIGAVRACNPPPAGCTLANAVPTCTNCHSANGKPYPLTHSTTYFHSLACANCHGPLDDLSGFSIPSIGMKATTVNGQCVLEYSGGTHQDGMTNYGVAKY